MRKWLVKFMKKPTVLGGNQVPIFASQLYYTDGDKINIEIPNGFQVIAIEEELKLQNQTNEILTN